jgi:cyclopropane fatty-acyl-phospholipid synthase-like methyltransferase
MRTHLDKVARLYDVTQAGYDFAASRDYLRYGFWDGSTRTSADALVNTDRFVAALLRLGKDDRVLDAGCGVGGAAIYFARTYGVRVVGVNICKVQLDRARQKVRQAGIEGQVRIEDQDFCATCFAEGEFTKLLAVESLFHAESWQRFAAEAHRLLAPGGRLAVVDRFLLRKEMDPKQTRLYDRFRAGQAVTQLSTVDEFRHILESAGFVEIEFIDKLRDIQRGVARTHWMCVFSWPLSGFLSTLRILPREVHGQTVALMAIRRLFAQGIVTYGGFCAVKPEAAGEGTKVVNLCPPIR